MKLVARLAMKPKNCRMVLFLQRCRASTAVIWPSSRAIREVRCNNQTARHKVAVTARTQVRKTRIAEPWASASRNWSITGMATQAPKAAQMPLPRIDPTSSQTARLKKVPHLGKPKAGQRLLKRCWTRYWKPRSSRTRITNLAPGSSIGTGSKYRAHSPPSQLNIKKRAAKRRCGVGAMSHSQKAVQPAIKVLRRTAQPFASLTTITSLLSHSAQALRHKYVWLIPEAQYQVARVTTPKPTVRRQHVLVQELWLLDSSNPLPTGPAEAAGKLGPWLLWAAATSPFDAFVSFRFPTRPSSTGGTDMFLLSQGLRCCDGMVQNHLQNISTG